MKADGKHDTNCTWNLVDLPQRRDSTYCLIIMELSRPPSLAFTAGLDNLLFCRCSIRPDSSYGVVSGEGDEPELMSGTLLLQVL
jgi:hypothetical protein